MAECHNSPRTVRVTTLLALVSLSLTSSTWLLGSLVGGVVSVVEVLSGTSAALAMAGTTGTVGATGASTIGAVTVKPLETVKNYV